MNLLIKICLFLLFNFSMCFCINNTDILLIILLLSSLIFIISVYKEIGEW